VQGVDIYSITDFVDAGFGGAGSVFEQKIEGTVQWLFIHPDQYGFKMAGDFGNIVGMNEHVSPAPIFQSPISGMRSNGVAIAPPEPMPGLPNTCHSHT
jgi:hypothetical protein